MLKRLIEAALPLKEVSEQSGTEKRQISAMHLWWARRPLSACRAVVFASLIPDPDDPECPDSFRTLVNDLLPQTPNGEDTPRIRCLEFIKHLVRWENSNNEELVGKARKLIAAAHEFLHPDADGDMPKVLDPFAGGGAIPLEAMRLGCEAHAIDLNPVAHLIELCTLVYPHKFGQPNSRPTPDYIKKLEAAHRSEGGEDLFESAAAERDGRKKINSKPETRDSQLEDIDGVSLTRLPLITEADYQKNPLVADVKFWGHWVLEKTRDEIGQFYPPDPDGSIPVAYLWARTAKCSNPACGADIPLVRQLWLSQKPNRRAALQMLIDRDAKKCSFRVTGGKQISFDPADGTMKRGQAECPFCHAVCSSKYLQTLGNDGKIGQRMLAIALVRKGLTGKQFRLPASMDTETFARASAELRELKMRLGEGIVPNEPLIPWSGVFNAPLFGMTHWGELFNDRQALSLVVLTRHVQGAIRHLQGHHEVGFASAAGTYLAYLVDKHADYNASLASWHSRNEQVRNVFTRQALPMVWDYCEANALGGSSGSTQGAINDILAYPPLSTPIRHAGKVCVAQGSALNLSIETSGVSCVVTDPPYYDAVPYSDLSDFFYVWLKRTVGSLYPELLRTPLTPKTQEAVSHLGNNYPGNRKTSEDYEAAMSKAFTEMHRILDNTGLCCVMFAHKTTSAWETLIAALIESGLSVTSSWPLRTEMKGRIRSQGSAALASSVTLVCRKRLETAGEGYWDDVRDELREVARERLDFFWQQGIRGADFFISAIGPALSVYGRYAKVTRLTGEEVSVGQFLDEVRGVVTDYALSQILRGAKTGQIDAETRFYVLWKWSYGDGRVAADEAFKLSQALGIDTEEMWDRTGVLEKQGQNVQALTVAKRMRIKDLGEPNVDGSPATLIDTLHRCCAFRDKGDTGGLSEYLARSGHARNEKLWTVAQAISEVLPDGDKEKQLLQGLLNQRDKIDEAMAEERLF